MADHTANVPAGFEQMPTFGGPFHELTGPFFYKKTDNGFVVGLRAEEKHRNGGEMIHGGMLAMLADTAISWTNKNTLQHRQPPVWSLTTNLSLSLIGNALPGDWIEARVEVVRAGQRVVFSNCFIWANDKCIAQATAQFQVIGRPAEPA